MFPSSIYKSYGLNLYKKRYGYLQLRTLNESHIGCLSRTETYKNSTRRWKNLRPSLHLKIIFQALMSY